MDSVPLCAPIVVAHSDQNSACELLCLSTLSSKINAYTSVYIPLSYRPNGTAPFDVNPQGIQDFSITQVNVITLRKAIVSVCIIVFSDYNFDQ